LGRIWAAEQLLPATLQHHTALIKIKMAPP